MVLPSEGGSATLSVTDDGHGRAVMPQYAGFHSEKLLNIVQARLSAVRQIRPCLASGVHTAPEILAVQATRCSDTISSDMSSIDQNVRSPTELVKRPDGKPV